MKARAARLWWIPAALGLAFLAHAVLGFFDPSGGMPSPYNELELFAAMPAPGTAKQAVQIIQGLLGVSTLVVVEFAYSSRSQLRAARSPGRLIVFIWAAFGFAVGSVDGIRLLRLMPDMAHYYYAQGGELRDIAAILLETVELDPFRVVLASGMAAWVLYLSVDLLSGGRPHRFWGAISVILVASLLALLISMVLNLGSLWNTVLDTVVRGVASPVWFIGMGVHLYRRRAVLPDET